MFDKVLVGVDEHQGGRDAAALGARLVAPGGGLTLAHIYPDRASPAVRGFDDNGYSEILRSTKLLRTVGESVSVGSEAKFRCTPATSAGRGLHELAEQLTADLLVVGSTRRGLLGRVAIGDDTSEALNGAPCAVAVAPAGYAESAAPIRAIGVGYDGSPDSERALATARALADELDASVAALEVVWWPARLFSGSVAVDSTRVADLVAAARDDVAALGDVEACAAYGRPAEELAQWSASLDLLVVGSRGWGPVGRLVHGSTSHALTRRAHCPLLVITRTPDKVTRPERRDSQCSETYSLV
jgi:nucleotide-binding universal stress UspA family protein